eukprot:3079276-Amphidinium_carterae.1
MAAVAEASNASEGSTETTRIPQKPGRYVFHSLSNNLAESPHRSDELRGCRPIHRGFIAR